MIFSRILDTVHDSLALRKQLLRVSDSVTETRGKRYELVSKLIPMCNALCTKRGIVAPALRSFPRMDDMGNYALTVENVLVINEGFLDFSPATIQGLLAHKLGHLVLGHTKSTPPVEREADKFAQFLLHPEHLEDWINYQDTKLRVVKLERMKQNLMSKVWRLGKTRSEEEVAAMFGHLEDRIAALREPLKPEEINAFEEAIKHHNRKFEPSRHVLKEDVIEEPPHGGAQKKLVQKVQLAQQGMRQREYGANKAAPRER